MTADTAITLQCTKLWKVYGADGEARLGERPLPEGQEAMSLAGADGAAFPIRTLVEKFRPEFEERIRNQEAGKADYVLSVLN